MIDAQMLDILYKDGYAAAMQRGGVRDKSPADGHHGGLMAVATAASGGDMEGFSISMGPKIPQEDGDTRDLRRQAAIDTYLTVEKRGSLGARPPFQAVVDAFTAGCVAEGDYLTVGRAEAIEADYAAQTSRVTYPLPVQMAPPQPVAVPQPVQVAPVAVPQPMQAPPQPANQARPPVLSPAQVIAQAVPVGPPEPMAAPEL